MTTFTDRIVMESTNPTLVKNWLYDCPSFLQDVDVIELVFGFPDTLYTRSIIESKAEFSVESAHFVGLS